MALRARGEGRAWWTYGWGLCLGLSLLSVAVCGGSLIGGGEEAIRRLVRNSARFSAAYFLVAFCASSFLTLSPGPRAAWLRANRRSFGVAFAASQTVHLAGLFALGAYHPDPFVSGLDALTLLGGGLAYAFTYAMAFTSTDAAVRRLGRSRWTLLHQLGAWFIWFIFLQTYTLGALAGEAGRVGPASLFWAALAVRLAAFRVDRRDRRAPRASIA